ncbi:MAG: DsbE family thiol:disulfide interchange protein [Rhodomicrobium sp.]|nr:DsbE family thiol:disulfide interchange protein [Rhodomicrobium sp.]
MKRLRFFLPMLIFAGVTAGLAFSLKGDPSKLPSTLMDKRAPEFSLPALEPGKPGLSSADLGKKIVLLNLFASWCGKCVYEHPTLMGLAKRSDIALYGINWKDEPGNGLLYLSRFQNPYRLVGEDREGRAGIDFGVTGVPETFVIDPSGRIRYRHAGPVTPEIWAEVFEPVIAKIKSEPKS